MPGRGPLALFVGLAEVGRRSVHRRPESAAIASADARVLTVEMQLTCSGPGGDVVGVEDVAVDVCLLSTWVNSASEHPPRSLFTPHGAQAHAAGGEGDGHAVHAGDGVQDGPSGWSRVSANVLDAVMSTHR